MNTRPATARGPGGEGCSGLGVERAGPFGRGRGHSRVVGHSGQSQTRRDVQRLSGQMEGQTDTGAGGQSWAPSPGRVPGQGISPSDGAGGESGPSLHTRVLSPQGPRDPQAAWAWLSGPGASPGMYTRIPWAPPTTGPPPSGGRADKESGSGRAFAETPSS